MATIFDDTNIVAIEYTYRKELIRRTIRDGSVLIYGVDYYPVSSKTGVSWQAPAPPYAGQLDGMRGVFRATYINTPNRIPSVSFHGIKGIPFKEQPNIIGGYIRWSRWLPSVKYIIHLHRVRNKIIGHYCKQLLSDYLDLNHPIPLTDEDVDYIKGLQS
jgi:hypothetical protein